jgi:hypothetical protein
MTSSIPDGISFGDLEDLQHQAAAREESEPLKAEGPYAGKTAEELVKYVRDNIERMSEDVPHAMLPKVVAYEMINSLMGWHSRKGMSISEGGTEHERCVSAMCWHRDAGKLQAIMNLLDVVDCGEGEEDFTCN